MAADLSDLGPLYHSYALFGVANQQIPGIYQPNQQAKAPILRAYIQYAIAKSRRTASDRVTFLELFCADGYYTMAARLFGADDATGIDNDRDGHLRLAPTIAARLGLDHVRFEQRDVHDLRNGETYTVVANLGGLYHVSDPLRVLSASWKAAARYLIVQSVVSLADRSADYFESPAPGWTWGCRFSEAWLHRSVAAIGGRIIDSYFNELEGNDRPDDRGSAYLLVERTDR